MLKLQAVPLALVLLLLCAVPLLATAGQGGIHCKVDLCGRNCGPERPPPCGTADTGAKHGGQQGTTGAVPYDAGPNGGNEGYHSPASPSGRDYQERYSTAPSTCKEDPVQKCPYGYTVDNGSAGLCSKESHDLPYFSCEKGFRGVVTEDGKQVCVERTYHSAYATCEEGYTKMFNLGARYHHVCIRMSYGDYEASCASPSYSLSTDAYGDRKCITYTDEESKDPSEVCEPPYALDEYHTCIMEDLKPPVLRCPYEYHHMKDSDGWCLKEEGEMTPTYSCTTGYPSGDRCVTGYKRSTAATATCYGANTLNPDTGKCSKRTWREADEHCEEDDGYKLISRGGASVCVKAKLSAPTLACHYGFVIDKNGKCRKEHSVPAEMRCADGFQPHAYLPRCIKMESRHPEPSCHDGYELQGEGLAAGCFKERRQGPSSVECSNEYTLRDGRCYYRQTARVQYKCRAGFRLGADGKCSGPCTGDEYAASGTTTSSSSSRPISRMQGSVSDAPGGAQEPPVHSQFDIAPLI